MIKHIRIFKLRVQVWRLDVTIGLILIPVNNYFIIANHLKYWCILPTNISLIYNLIIMFFCRSPFPVTVCSVVFCHETARMIDHLCHVSVASAIAGDDMMQTVVLLVYIGWKWMGGDFWIYLLVSCRNGTKLGLDSVGCNLFVFSYIFLRNGFPSYNLLFALGFCLIRGSVPL